MECIIRNKKGTCLGRFVAIDHKHMFSVLNDYFEKYPEEALGVTILIQPCNHEISISNDAANLQEQADFYNWDN